jgi:glutamyl-tRNA reductase
MSYKPKAIYVANRTLANAKSLVQELGFGEAFGLDELPNLLTEADVVISSTSAPGMVLEMPMIKRAQAARRARPMVLLDIALPRDIDPNCGNVEDVYLFDIDDLQQVVGSNFKERQQAAEEAEVLIAKSIEQFRAWQKTLVVKPSLAAFRNFLDELIQRETTKTLSRDMFKDLNEKQQEALSGLFSAISGKISGEAAKNVTNPPNGYYQEQLADALTALFGRKDPPT